MVVLCLGVCMGGPLLLLPSLLAVLVYGSWTAVAAWIFIVVFLAAHPVPACAESLRSSSLAMALYRYFSYRFVWSGDAKAAGEQVGAWIGAGPPHGVLPFANVLSIPAINTFSFCKFVGAGASVVAHTPFLRYMALFGMIDVSAKSIARSIGAGVCVGTVPDGIAGIFKCSESAEVVEPKTRTARRACTPPCTHASLHALTPAGTHPQVVKLKTRKGLAKLALKTGTPIVPAYSVGNTAAYTAVFDRWGVLEALSRKAQASIFLYWGRFGLPIPRRANVTIPATHGALTSPGTQRSVHDSSCCCTVCAAGDHAHRPSHRRREGGG